MSATRSVQELNEELARQINEEACRDPHSKYFGKFIGIANGQVVVVADNLETAVHELLRIEPDPRKAYCLEAGIREDEVHEIWGLG